MTRLPLLSIVCATSIALSPGLGHAAATTLSVTSGLSPTHVVATQGLEPWMACVTEQTNKEVTFNYFPGGQIASVKDTSSALQSGLADAGFVSAPNETSTMPLQGLAMLPGGGKSAVELTAAYRASIDAGSPLLAEMISLKLRPFLVNSLVPYQIMARSKRLDTEEKFAGVKVRVSGGAMGATTMALGAVPIEMAAGEMYIAMERGTIDGTLFSLSSVKTYSLQELITSMSSNASFGTSSQFFAISDAAWERLEAPHQKAVLDCGLKVERSLAEYLDADNRALMKEFADLGIEIFQFSEDELAKINVHLDKAAQDYVGRLAARGLPAQEAFDSLRKKPAQ